MATARVRISDKTFLAAMQAKPVREALRAKAVEKQARAEQIADQEGVELDSKIVEGTRPRGRPFARVQSSNAAQEYGTSIVERKRILGRAAEGS